MSGEHAAGWDLATGVGATATMVAAGRAVASKEPGGLINDPFAQPLVEAVGLEFFTKQVRGELDTDGIDQQSLARVRSLIDEVAVRTKFFDDYFLRSARAGVFQMVILASGLDARAYRLAWPAATVIYEIDQPAVIEFKTATLAALGANPTAERRTVAIDLRDDWPAALGAAGFDVEAPAAWSAEGLLMYLPATAQGKLFQDITRLSAPYSTLAADYLAASRNVADSAITEDWRRRGFTLDMAAMTFTSEASDLIEQLRAQHWQIDVISRADLFARYGVELSAAADVIGETAYLTGKRIR
ncbi:SAM-dependent methyltransferase [uncultured Mycobacterium sp.]|uniref:SAM-dependent methyltransferase n=1 Tax=uncultured Mycobacterium sp. TaxID=171292 RepID=UPI0035CC5803